MRDGSNVRIAIVDYGMGNLFSVSQACQQAGLQASVTTSRHEILSASAVILPGVGAFGLAMETLNKLDLVGPLRDVAASQAVLMGICLGMQLLMTESQEFGRHGGLGIVEGEAVPLPAAAVSHGFKVPHIGWNQIHGNPRSDLLHSLSSGGSTWKGSFLEGLPDGDFMYFVHSYYCKPVDSAVLLSTTRYGPIEFCSALHRGNIMGCQFHPERSGQSGLRVYRNLSAMLNRSLPEISDVPEI